jgi:CheY-like chemotaxis protein
MPLDGPTSKVLIVDDDKVMSDLLLALLAFEGYDVAHAVSGQEALEQAGEMGPSLGVVLCDLQMPGMPGQELAAALSRARSDGALSADTVLLGMSGSKPAEEERRDFDAFLLKPFSVRDFGSLVKQVRKQRSSQESSLTPSREDGPISGSSGAKTAPLSGKLPPLDGKTYGQLRSKLGADQLRQLYGMTLDDVRSRLGTMANAAIRGDQATIRREAHTIKGSCGMVGALELQALAAATEGGSTVDTSALAEFAAACQRVERMLEETP